MYDTQEKPKEDYVILIMDNLNKKIQRQFNYGKGEGPQDEDEDLLSELINPESEYSSES